MLAPIDGGVGVAVTYEESFEAMKNETEKLVSLAGGKVDIASYGDLPAPEERRPW